jgi:DNA-binding GntR family transcriptional regulator
MADVSVLESKAQDDGRTSTTSDEVYEKLRLAIVTGEIRPNAPLIEVDLANALNVSRTPIRESLQRLAADQLVVPRKRGWAVKEYSAQEIQESYEVRAALEGYAARLAATRASDRQFHDGIIKAARNDRLAEAIYRSGRFYFNERIAAITSREDFAANQSDHARIVHALQSRDPAGAEEAMRSHILNTFTAFLRVGGR